MRNTMLFLLLGLLSLSLFGTPTITGRCKNGGAYPSCVGGEIVFSGPSFHGQVHVTVTNSAGKVIDDGEYTTNAGILTFTENLSFADTYTISVDDQAVLTVTTN